MERRAFVVVSQSANNIPRAAKAAIDFAAVTARLAVSYPLVLDHSSESAGRRGKPRLYSTFFREP
jgi:hypothetical protein